MSMTEGTWSEILGKKLRVLEGAKAYMMSGWHRDVGFHRLPGRSERVACIICGRAGPGYAGDYWTVSRHNLNRWQDRCLMPHTDLCACGKAYPTKHALAMHVQATRRHRIPGHGRMDQVGH